MWYSCSMERTCGTCTKCCDGTLSGEIKGHKMGAGKPCHFLKIGQGCTIYDDRPQEPCKRYVCAWIIDDEIPDFMKPENSNCILDYIYHNNVKYLRLAESDKPYSAEVLSWCIDYAKTKGLNFTWMVNHKSYWIGDPEFFNSIAEAY